MLTGDISGIILLIIHVAVEEFHYLMYVKVLSKIKTHAIICNHLYYKLSNFLKDFIYLFLERGREGEREGEKHQCVVASQAPPTGDLARIPGMCPDWEWN